MALQDDTQLDSESFVEVTYDKFEDKQVTRFIWPDTLDSLFFSNLETFVEVDEVDEDFEDEIDDEVADEVEEVVEATGFSLYLTLRHVKMSEVDSIVFDYIYQGADWGLVRDGKFIIRINDEINIPLEPAESDNSDGIGSYNGVQEVGYYIIGTEELKAICDAESIEMKITGGKFEVYLDYSVVEEGSAVTIVDKFLFLCRGFYAGLYDDDSYLQFSQEILQASLE